MKTLSVFVLAALLMPLTMGFSHAAPEAAPVPGTCKEDSFLILVNHNGRSTKSDLLRALDLMGRPARPMKLDGVISGSGSPIFVVSFQKVSDDLSRDRAVWLGMLREINTIPGVVVDCNSTTKPVE